METIYFLGVDISKDYFDAALTVNGKDFHQTQIVNKVKSIEAFVKHFKEAVLPNESYCLHGTHWYLLFAAYGGTLKEPSQVLPGACLTDPTSSRYDQR